MLTGWNYWRKITVDQTKIDETLTDFPVTVQLTEANFDFDKAQTSGDDIRFTAANGTSMLAYERVSHDATAKTAEYHVKVPVVKADAATFIYLYYGNEAASDGADPEEVWTNNYSAVWHMRDGVDSLHISDSTGNGYTGAKGDVIYPARAPIEATGKIGKSQQFDGTNDYINCGDVLDQTTNDFTLSAWAKTTSTLLGNANGILYKRGTAADTNIGYSLNLPNGEARFQIADGSQYSSAQSVGAGVNDGNFHHIVGRAKRGINVQLFIDSTARAPITSTWTTSIANSIPLGIGAYNGAYHFFSGCLDEIRISSVARTNAWIKAEYNDGNNTLITVGVEETVGYTPAPSEETHVLVEIELDGETLRFADEHLSMSDGNFYEGRASVSNLSRSFSSWTEPKQTQSTLTLTLADQDGTIRALLESSTWGLRRVKLFVGRGRDRADYVLDFEGVIKFPSGISYTDRAVTVRIRDARDSEYIMLPVNKFWTTEYPNLEDGADGTCVPIVYGDWSDTPLPVTCTDTVAREFTVADHPLAALVRVYVNGEAVTPTAVNLSAATFVLGSYTPGTDEVTAAVMGRRVAIWVPITHPVDILRDLMENLVGISGDSIDTDAFDAAKSALGTFEARRFLNAELSSNTLIEELAIECGFDVFIRDGLYTITDRVPSQTYDATYDDTTVVADSFGVEYDPEGLYANQLKAEYDYDPANDTYRGGYQLDDTEEQTVLGQVVSRTMQFNWLFAETDVQTVVQQAMMFYCPELRSVTFTALGEGLLEELSSRIGIAFANFALAPLALTVREISKNFKSRSAEITGYDMALGLQIGRWTDDAAPNYEHSSAAEATTNGFWTDDNGYAAPGDESSLISKWW